MSGLRRHVRPVLIRAASTCAVASLLASPAAAQSGKQIAGLQSTDLLAKFFAPDSKPLRQYRALRTLTATTRGGKMSATMTAWTSLDPEHGFQFKVVSEEGSAIIRRKVLLAALEAEQNAVATGDREQAAITAANYEFLDMSPAPANLVKIDVRPRRKHVMLVDGSLFLEAESADLVRIEGELSRRPSMWTRNVKILREYARVEGVHVPVAMSSTASVLIVGTSTFSMTYKYVEVNGKPTQPRDYPALAELQAEPVTRPVIRRTSSFAPYR
ncbi:MAG TPA: hypothetical protein VH497_19670 [Vicinamibacterales bacterium]|jgi:hypothetical protein